MKLSSQEETVETYSYIVTTLAERHPDLAFLHVVESRTAGSENAEASESETLDFIVRCRVSQVLLSPTD